MSGRQPQLETDMDMTEIEIIKLKVKFCMTVGK